MFEVDPQPRIDVLVTDAATGEQRRRTTYSGMIWLGGRIDVTASVQVSRSGAIDAPVILPDSLAYDPAKLADATVTAAWAIGTASSRDGQAVVGLRRVGFVPDPQGRPPMWLQLHLAGRGMLPCGITYQVEAYTVPDPLLPAP